MPLHTNSGFRGGGRYRETTALPLPGPAVVIDVRQGNDARLIRYLATEVEDLAAVGRDLECVALARAVRWHLEHRVLLDGKRTVVFP